MANVTYNPTVQTPAYDFKPQGFLGGYLYGNDLTRAQNMQPIADLMTKIDAQKQAVGLQDLLATHEGQNAATNATNAAVAATIGRAKEAEVKGQELTNIYNDKTLNSRIATTLSENALKQGQNGLAQLDLAASKAELLGKAISSKEGPHTPAEINAWAQEHQIDTKDPIVQHVLNAGPGKYSAAAKQVHSWYDDASAQARQAQALQAQRDAAAMERQKQAGRDQLAVANARAAAKAKSAVDLLREAKTPIEAVTRAASILSDPDMDPRVKAMAQKVIMENQSAYKALVGKGVLPNLPGLPPVNIQAPFSGGPTTGQPDPLGLR